VNVLVFSQPGNPFASVMADIAEAARGLEWNVTVCDLDRFSKNASHPPDMIFLQGTTFLSAEELPTPSPSKNPFHGLRDLPSVCFVFEPEPPFGKDYMEESDHRFFQAVQGPDALFLSPDRGLVKRMKDLGLNKAFSFPETGLCEVAPIIEQFFREHLLFKKIEGMFTGDATHDFQLLSHGAVAETVQYNGDYYVYRLASLAMDMGESSLASEYIHMALEVNPAYLEARRLALEIHP